MLVTLCTIRGDVPEEAESATEICGDDLDSEGASERRTRRVLYDDGRGGSAVKRERPPSVDHVVAVAELAHIARLEGVEVGAPIGVVRDGLDGCGG